MTSEYSERGPEKPTTRQIRADLAGLALDASIAPDKQALIALATKRLEVLDNLSELLGQLAPGGTAPRTALEEINRQARAGDTTTSQVVLDLRHMLSEHYGEWTPTLRQIEGLPPASSEDSKA